MREFLQKLFSLAGFELKLQLTQGESNDVIVMKAAELKVLGESSQIACINCTSSRRRVRRVRPQAILNGGPGSIDQLER